MTTKTTHTPRNRRSSSRNPDAAASGSEGRTNRAGPEGAPSGPADGATRKGRGQPRAYDAALRLLAARPLSVAEVRRRLARRGAAPAEVESALRALCARGYLDDRALAYNVASTLATRKKFGRARVAAELGRRGIDAEAVRGALEHAFAEIDEDAVALEAARAEAARGQRGGSGAAGGRIARLLMRRGFSRGAVAKALQGIGIEAGALAGGRRGVGGGRSWPRGRTAQARPDDPGTGPGERVSGETDSEEWVNERGDDDL